MSWPFTRIESITRAAAMLIAFATVVGHTPAHGEGLESALMPGKVIQGHAKVESDCSRCHVRFDRSAQPRLCLDCHKAVARDVRERAGYHGRIPQRECRACHTEHRGRDAQIVQLDEKRFDHATSDFVLRGRHAAAACAGCHRAGTRHRDAPSDCAACHRKDDVHRARLGADCARCHDADSWRSTTFHHAKTRFPLLQRHARAPCRSCHVDKTFADAPLDCLSCHRKDDAHKGRFGVRCGSCHDAADWKAPTFQHDRDTHFPLRDRHRIVRCDTCHRGALHDDKLPTACQACHRKDDVHKGALGEKCAACHTEARWKASRFDHDRDTRFDLRGRHRQTRCEQCHRDAQFRPGAPVPCASCHAADDRARGHQGRYGARCETCHMEDGWKTLRFRHERDTRYPLRGAHGRIACDACHRGPLYGEPLRSECRACHEKDDRHKGQLGSRCVDCHREDGWRDTRFDHARSRFPLRDRHADVPCRQCHLTPAFRDAAPDCVACHAKDDIHRARLGRNCAQCHDAKAWKGASFDHDRRTRFRLEGAHARTSCLACHAVPLREKPQVPPACGACHIKRDDVHFGSLGPRCERCHVPLDWRKIVRPPHGDDGAVDAAANSRADR